jgi:hypothetical protein
LHPDALHDRCVQRLRGIEIPRPFRLDVFAATVAGHRRRALHILPLPGLDGSDGLSGAWVATDTADYVLIDADASPWHRNLIGLHEISHLLCGHDAEDRGLRELAAGLLPCLSNVTIQRILGRRGFSSSAEQEAELMACLILAGLPVSAFGVAREAAIDLASLRALRDLWSDLADGVPGVGADQWKRGGVGSVRDPRIRLIHRIAEIRDAALALRCYVPADTTAENHRRLSARGLKGTALDAATEACWLQLAIRAARTGAPPAETAHVLPGGVTLQEEVRWLRQVAAATHSGHVRAVAAKFLEAPLTAAPRT